MMKKLLSSLMMVSAMFTFASCLKSTDDNTTYYDDTAVTAFKLGTVNQYKTTKAKDGVTDSTYKVSYSASSYTFYIDQLQRVIYNPDSLPYGTDATKIVCTLTTKNGGTAVITLKNQAGEDSLAYYSSTDSVDFSSPRKVRVYSNSNAAYRDYTVRVNVHQQTGEEMSWRSTTFATLSTVGARKMVYNASELYLFGVKDGQTVVFRQNGTAMEQLAPTFGADAYKSAVALGGYLYVLNGGSVMRSADGSTWQQMGSDASLTQLVGAGSAKLYALTADGIKASADNGATWAAESLDDDAANLPTDNVSFVCMTAKANAQTNNLILVGQRGDKTVIWRKVEENATGAQSQPWAFYTQDDYNKLALPFLANLQVMGYDDGLIALGGDFSTFYESKDQGITWIATDDMALTSAFGLAASPFAMVADSNNYMHISKAGSTAVWLGRLARLGWATNQEAFTE